MPTLVLQLISLRRCMSVATITKSFLTPHIAPGNRFAIPLLCAVCHHSLFSSSAGFKISSSLSYKPTTSNPAKPLAPPQLLIYDAGTPRFLSAGLLKASTLWFLGFCWIVISPTYFYNAVSINWGLGIPIIIGAMPFAAITLMTGPMAYKVHIELPQSARTNSESLSRFSQSLSSCSSPVRLTVTSMNMFGFPKRQHLLLRELHFCHTGLLPYLRLAPNIEWVGGKQRKDMTWWEWFRAPRRDFYFTEEDGMRANWRLGVWKHVWNAVEKNSYVIQ